MTNAQQPAGSPAVASMTAFARRVAVGDAGDLAWEIKSVNGKGLDTRLRCPPGFEAAENRFRARISAAVSRGSVQATLTAARAAAPPRVRVNAVLLRSLVEAVGAAVPQGAADRLGPLTLDGLLSIRGVIEIDDNALSAEAAAAEAAQAEALLEATLDDLKAMRTIEGEALRRLLLAHLGELDKSITAAERAPGRTAEAIFGRLSRAVADLFDAVPALDPARLHQEAVLLAMRADVREEIDRLRLHSGAMRTLLEGGGVVGRRLDFLAQELAREANTLCAKSNDVELTAIGLALRNRIEQLREQVQNLE
jgi:uncharacterized protein (TIGR00255 family)